MRKSLLLFTFLISSRIQAQQMISVIDLDTRNPICRALFIQDDDTIAYTSPQGIAMVPKKPGKIIVAAKDYKTITINADSLPAVICIKSELEQLDEVVVIGNKSRVRPPKTKWDEDNNLKAKKTGSGGVCVSIDAIFRAFGYRPASELKRKRVKKQLDAY